MFESSLREAEVGRMSQKLVESEGIQMTAALEDWNGCAKMDDQAGSQSTHHAQTASLDPVPDLPCQPASPIASYQPNTTPSFGMTFPPILKNKSWNPQQDHVSLPYHPMLKNELERILERQRLLSDSNYTVRHNLIINGNRTPPEITRDEVHEDVNNIASCHSELTVNPEADPGELYRRGQQQWHQHHAPHHERRRGRSRKKRKHRLDGTSRTDACQGWKAGGSNSSVINKGPARNHTRCRSESPFSALDRSLRARQNMEARANRQMRKRPGQATVQQQRCGCCSALEKALIVKETNRERNKKQVTQQEKKAEESPENKTSRRSTAFEILSSIGRKLFCTSNCDTKPADEPQKSSKYNKNCRRDDDVDASSNVGRKSDVNRFLQDCNDFLLGYLLPDGYRKRADCELPAPATAFYSKQAGMMDHPKPTTSSNRQQQDESQKRRKRRATSSHPQHERAKRRRRVNHQQHNRRNKELKEPYSSDPGKHVKFASPISVVHTINRPESKYPASSAAISACASGTCLAQNGAGPVPSCQEKGEALLPTWGYSVDELMPEHLDLVFSESERKFLQLDGPSRSYECDCKEYPDFRCLYPCTMDKKQPSHYKLLQPSFFTANEHSSSNPPTASFCTCDRQSRHS